MCFIKYAYQNFTAMHVDVGCIPVGFPCTRVCVCVCVCVWQAKSVFQAEIDSTCETIDFFRFAVKQALDLQV